MNNSFDLLKKYKFRVVVTQGLNGPLNMAADEVLLKGCREGKAVLRFYDWHPPTLSLGYFQRLDPKETEACRQRGVPLVRRPTGGRAVFHEDEVTYSIVLPLRREQGRTWSTHYYAAISEFLLQGLVKLGVKEAKIHAQREKNHVNGKKNSPWCFEAKNFSEIAVKNKKLVGSAQRLYPQGLLQHGSIIRRISLDPGTEAFWPRGADGLLLATSLEEILGIKPAFGEVVKVYTGILQELRIPWEFSALKKNEERLMAELARGKYERLNWHQAGPGIDAGIRKREARGI